MEEQADRYTVHSVRRALDLLEVVAGAPPGGLTLTAIANRLGISKSTALATARTLASRGLLALVDPGPRYVLGLSLLRYGDIAARQNPIGELCVPILRGLSSTTGMTARAALAEEGRPICIERVEATPSLRPHAPLGGPEPAHATATGKAVLATFDEERVRTLCAESGMTRHTPHTIGDVDALLADLGQVRRRGFAIDDEERALGVFCVGAAFFGRDGRCVGAISVTGLKRDLPTGNVGAIGRLVRTRADEVSNLLGGPNAVALATS